MHKLRIPALTLFAGLALGFAGGLSGRVQARSLPTDLVTILSMDQAKGDWILYSKKYSELILDPKTVSRIKAIEDSLAGGEINPASRYRLTHIRIWGDEVQQLRFDNDYGDISLIDLVSANPYARCDLPLSHNGQAEGVAFCQTVIPASGNSPAQVVSAFFNWYIKGEKGGYANQKGTLLPEFGKEMDQIYSWRQGPDAQGPFIDSDPISGQGGAYSFRVGPATVKGNVAHVEVIVMTGIHRNGPSAWTAVLTQVQGRWLISDLLDHSQAGVWSSGNPSLLAFCKKFNADARKYYQTHH